MKVIPVIDILNGVVVHAVRGKRSEYKPLQSNLAKSVEPVEVAEAFKTLGFSELYVADLDAIIDCSADFQGLKKIADQTELALMVDAGVTSIEHAERLFENSAAKLIVGTETLADRTFIAKAVKRFGSERIVVSLDLKAGKVLVKEGFDGCTEPLCLLKEFKAAGVSQVIVLDLARVGSGEGVDMDFLKKVIDEVGVDIYVGGGVRDLDDLVELKALGVSGALIATALHTGKIDVSDIKRNGFL